MKKLPSRSVLENSDITSKIVSNIPLSMVASYGDTALQKGGNL
jgi:hypothetical protein